MVEPQRVLTSSVTPMRSPRKVPPAAGISVGVEQVSLAAGATGSLSCTSTRTSAAAPVLPAEVPRRKKYSPAGRLCVRQTEGKPRRQSRVSAAIVEPQRFWIIR
ncbi:MAG: hypothetical protein IPN17_21700 [Deltaproteobacteria bacterium]|nr:hypothetical protein [Deltaproteobacteria bacterium]